MLNLLPSLLAVLPQGPGTSTAPVVINEFQYDDSGTDDREFAELYNRTTSPVDISGWTLINRDPGSPLYGGTGTDPTYVIPGGTILAPGAFYVLGPATGVANVNLVIGTINLFENSNESLELLDTTGAIVDSLAYELGLGIFGPHPLEGDGFLNNWVSVDAAQISISRSIDGRDFDDNGKDFWIISVGTPGTTNSPPNALPVSENFDAGTVGAPVSNFAFGFVPPRHLDPTVVDSNNLTAKPPSPQGGLAMSWWDNTGGGNGVQLTSSAVSDVVIECYAWFEPTMAPIDPAGPLTTCGAVTPGTYEPSAGEWWGIGVRGTCSHDGNPPNVPGDYFTIVQPGIGTRHGTNTGVAWMYYRTTQYARLYLVDLGNGINPVNPVGPDWTILAGPIDIVAGVNDGWQRLRIHAQGDRVIANLGGNYGCDNGLRVAATGVYESDNGVWLAYREAMCNNGLIGNPLIDALDIHVPTTTHNVIGTGSPTTVGTPSIDSNGLAIIGSSGFAITGSGMVPLGNPNYAFCGMVLGFTTIPAGFPVPGAPPTVNGYVVVLASQVGFADAAGNVSFALPLPCNPFLLGTPLVSQIVDFDLGLFFPLPIGTTPALQTFLGN